MCLGLSKFGLGALELLQPSPLSSVAAASPVATWPPPTSAPPTTRSNGRGLSTLSFFRVAHAVGLARGHQLRLVPSKLVSRSQRAPTHARPLMEALLKTRCDVLVESCNTTLQACTTCANHQVAWPSHDLPLGSLQHLAFLV